MHGLTAILALSVSLLQAQFRTVPMLVEGNAPIVEVSFPRAGKTIRNARFLIDTAGGSMMLGSKLVKDLGAVAAGREIVQGGDRFLPLKPFAMALGGTTLKLEGTRIFGVLDSERPVARSQVEGLLPASVLRNYRVTIDYPGQKFTLGPPNRAEGKGLALKAGVHAESGFLRVEAQVDGSSFGFMLDTASSFTTVSRGLLEQWAVANRQWPRALGAVGFADMFGGSSENAALILRVPDLTIATIKLEQPAAVSRPEGEYEKYISALTAGPVVGAIAGNVLRDFKVDIDYLGGMIYLERGEATTADTDLTTVGLVLGADKAKGLLVTGFSTSAALDVPERVTAGDRLLKVGDALMQGASLAAAAIALSGEEGSQKELTLERDGQEVKVTVTVSAILKTLSREP